jgi:nucleoside phosphorylase
MPQFIAIHGENGRVQYINVGLIRCVQDLPDEDSVRVEFDEQHRLYLDRSKAAELLERLGKL